MWAASIREDLPHPLGPTNSTSRVATGISVIVVSVNRLKLVSRISRTFIGFSGIHSKAPTVPARDGVGGNVIAGLSASAHHGRADQCRQIPIIRDDLTYRGRAHTASPKNRRNLHSFLHIYPKFVRFICNCRYLCNAAIHSESGGLTPVLVRVRPGAPISSKTIVDVRWAARSAVCAPKQ